MATSKADTTTAVVCIGDNGGTVTTMPDVDKLLADYRAWSSTTLDIAKGIEPVKIRGASFPIRVENIFMTKEVKGRDRSYCVTCTVGSLKNCRGDGVGVGDDFILLPIQVGKNASDEHLGLPKSLVDGSELTHMLISSESRITMFCRTNMAQCLSQRGIFYAVSVSPTFTLRKPSQGGGAPAAPAAAKRPIAGGWRKPLPGQTGMRHIPLGLTAFPGGPKQPAARAVDDVDDTAAAAHVIDWDADDVFMRGGSTASSEALKELVASVPPPTMGSGRYSSEAKKRYQDPTYPAERRRRLELEFPEYALDNAVPLMLRDKYVSASVMLNCQQIIPVQEQQYIGQSDSDTLELYKLCPEFETIVDETTIDDPNTDTIVVARPVEEELRQLQRDRIAALKCKVPVLCEVTYRTTIEQIPGQQKRSPWLAYSKDGANTPRFKFMAAVTAWKPDTSYTDALAVQTLYKVSEFGDVFSHLIGPTFGITNNDAWEKFAELILTNTEIWYTASYDAGNTAKLTPHRSKLDTKSIVAVRVKHMNACFDRALRERIGVPITLRKVADLLGRPVPTEVERRAAKLAELPGVKCLTEQPIMLPEAAVAGCEFYALVSPSFYKMAHDNGVRVGDLGPEIGAALFTADWYKFDRPYVIEGDVHTKVSMTKMKVEDGRVTIDPTDPVRQATMQIGRDLIQAGTSVYVYAVRPNTGVNAKRAENTLSIFWEGGRYDPTGIPVIDPALGEAAQPAVLAIADAPAVPTLPAPVPVALAADDQEYDPFLLNAMDVDISAAATAAEPALAKTPKMAPAFAAGVVNGGRTRPRSPSPGPVSRSVARKTASGARAKP